VIYITCIKKKGIIFMKSFIAVFFAITALFFASTLQVNAAAPDGSGPWADAVVNFSQGLTKAGGAIDANRSDPSQALGVAEQTVTPGTFVSLGFGGSITLQFDNGISNGVFVVESTNPDYPVEHAHVDLSADGSTWFSAGNLDQTGTVTQPDSLTCAQYVRVTDTSNSADFSEDTADAYDVDGVQAMEGQACTVVTPTPTPFVCRDNEDCVTPTPTVTPTETVTPTPYVPPSDHGDGKSDGGSSCPSCTQSSGGSGNVLGASTEGQVLGASTDTLAATGTQSSMASILASVTVSIAFLMMGLKLSAKKV
jgi:hypothetical protein